MFQKLRTHVRRLFDALGDWDTLISIPGRIGWVWRTLVAVVVVLSAMFAWLSDLRWESRVVLSLGAMALALATVNYAFGLYVHARVLRDKPTDAKKTHEIQTLRDLFKSDFKHTLSYEREYKMTPTVNGVAQPAVMVLSKLYLDFDSMAEFAGFFVPMTRESPKALICGLADHVATVRENRNDVQVISGGLSGQHTDSRDLKFSGRVYVYHEGLLSTQEMADLLSHYKARGFSLELRGTDYLGLHLARH